MRRINQFVVSVYLLARDHTLDAMIGTYSVHPNDDEADVVRHAVAAWADASEFSERLFGVVQQTCTSLLIQGRTAHGVDVRIYDAKGHRAWSGDYSIRPEHIVGIFEAEEERRAKNEKALARAAR